MMHAWNDAQMIEFFHLAFLQVAQGRLDQAGYAVKGGASLRYFFGSMRYSEDLDLDAIDMEPWQLEQKVDHILASPAMGLLLRSGGLSRGGVTKPKQTPTTQRWKLWLTVDGRQKPVRTKIEFSHREADPRRLLEAVPERVVSPYALRPPSMQHYTADAAIEQKVNALAHRRETQARDLFDLELLLRRHRDALDARRIAPDDVDTALDRIFDLPFEAYQDQVVPFIEPDAVELYDDRVVWEQAQAFVAERLMELR
jgi:predicted nucleotidyltransferase component of viral defense system